jgi:hypothetical protein
MLVKNTNKGEGVLLVKNTNMGEREHQQGRVLVGEEHQQGRGSFGK